MSESEVLAQAAEAEAKRLAATELRDFRVELLHGQMSSEAKAQAMDRFASGEAAVLVATTVIEVGIDVPNATVMLVEGAERFGLSQLHQLRGRWAAADTSPSASSSATRSSTPRARLDAIATESDGFALAEVDLSIRGRARSWARGSMACRGSGRRRCRRTPRCCSRLVDACSSFAPATARSRAAALGPLMDEARRRFGDERVEQISA